MARPEGADLRSNQLRDADVLDKCSSCSVTETLVLFAQQSLTQTQKNVLMRLPGLEGRTLSSVLPQLAADMEMDPSTVRRAVAALRDQGLVESGSKECKPVPLRLTQPGESLLFAVIGGDTKI